MSPQKLEYSWAKDAIPGARPYQEDYCEVWRSNGSNGEAKAEARPLLAVLSDGMGGHVSGEIASREACLGYIRNFSSETGSIDQLLEHSLVASNDALNSAIVLDKRLDGMGCTMVAAYIDTDGLRWVSVGDSKLLLYRDGKLKQLNEDHSLGALLDSYVAANKMTKEEAQSNPRRRTLRSALTGGALNLKDLQTAPHPVQHDDWIIVASDGLETLSGDEIARAVAANSQGEPGVMVKTLLKQVEQRRVEHQDNTTVIAIHIADPAMQATLIVSPVAHRSAGPDTVPVALQSAGQPGRTAGSTVLIGLVLVVGLALAAVRLLSSEAPPKPAVGNEPGSGTADTSSGKPSDGTPGAGAPGSNTAVKAGSPAVATPAHDSDGKKK